MEGGEYSKVFSTVSSDNSVSFYDVACYGKCYSEAHICPLLGSFPSHPVPKQNPSQNPAALLTPVRTCQEKPFSVKRITLIYSQTCVQRAGPSVGTRAELLHPPPSTQPKLHHQNGSFLVSSPILSHLTLLSQLFCLKSSARSLPQFLRLSHLEWNWDVTERF